MKMRMHPFSCGTYVVNRGVMDNLNWGKPYEHPLPMLAIRHPKGLALFDLGHNHRALANPADWFGEEMVKGFLAMNIKESDCLPWQLRSAGIDPNEVTHVILSHMHIDHAGEMASFPNAQFMVRKSEISYAWWPAANQRLTYVFNDLKPTRFYHYLEIPDQIDFDVFGDGSLVLIHTPGHTPGHQSLVLRLPDYDKIMLFCADACYTAFNFEGNLYSPGLLWNVEAWHQTIQKLRHYAKIGHEVWFGHDMENWRERIKPFI